MRTLVADHPIICFECFLVAQAALPAQREYLEQARQLQQLQQLFQSHSNGINTHPANVSGGGNVTSGSSGGSGSVASGVNVGSNNQAMLDEEEEIRQAIAESLRQHHHR